MVTVFSLSQYYRNSQNDLIAPRQQHINDTVKLVFGQERSLFPYPKTRDNIGTSKEINLSATFPVPTTNGKQGGWVGKRHEVEKRCDRYESDREIEIQYRINQN